jgi:sensor histidine kinase regulating citrate/malate metabolism
MNIMMIVLGIINIVQYYILEQLNKLQVEKIERVRIEEIYNYKDDYYQEVEKQQQEIRKIRHDLKNQFIILKSYLDKKKYQLVEQEISNILQDVVTIEEHVFTKNQVVNALINAKLKIAKEMDIICEISVKLPPNINIIDRDIIQLLGNLLDNCIESCLRVSQERSLHLTIFYQNGVVLIHSKNATDVNEIVLKTRKQGKKEHGIGMKSIMER